MSDNKIMKDSVRATGPAVGHAKELPPPEFALQGTTVVRDRRVPYWALRDPDGWYVESMDLASFGTGPTLEAAMRDFIDYAGVQMSILAVAPAHELTRAAQVTAAKFRACPLVSHEHPSGTDMV